MAGTLRGHALLSSLFAFFDCIDLTAAGWSVDGRGRWRCVYCTRRANLMRVIPGGKVSP